MTSMSERPTESRKMTYQDKVTKEKNWHKRAMLITYYHTAMKLRRRRWTMRMTAKKLDISIGMVSESIKLTHAILDNPDLENLKREDVLYLLK